MDKSTITPEWIKSEMARTGLNATQIANFTGIPLQQISNWSTGNKKMSASVKVMFYLIFLKRADLFQTSNH